LVIVNRSGHALNTVRRHGLIDIAGGIMDGSDGVKRRLVSILIVIFFIIFFVIFFIIFFVIIVIIIIFFLRICFRIVKC
jgi:hypothetical protein